MNYYIWNYETPLGEESAIMAVTEDGHTLGIPADPANVDYQEYLAWCEAGNTPEPYNPESEPPLS
jgi:hypothetical protein